MLYGLSFLSCCFKCRAFCCVGLSCMCASARLYDCLCVDYAVFVVCFVVGLFLAVCIMLVLCVVFVLCLGVLL